MHGFSTISHTMSESSILSCIDSEDWPKHTGRTLRPAQARLSSRATLDALDNISRNSIPLIGFAHPNRGPIPSPIREIWQMNEETLQMRDWLAEPSFLPLKGNPDFGPIQRLTPRSAPTPPLSPAQGNGAPLELDLYAPGPSRLPSWESTKKRQDSFFPPTPVISLSDTDEEPTELSLGNSTTSAVENEAEVLLAVDGLSKQTEIPIYGTGREALSDALNKVRARRSCAWSQSMPDVSARGELEKLIDIMGLADQGEAEY